MLVSICEFISYSSAVSSSPSIGLTYIFLSIHFSAHLVSSLPAAITQARAYDAQYIIVTGVVHRWPSTINMITVAVVCMFVIPLMMWTRHYLVIYLSHGVQCLFSIAFPIKFISVWVSIIGLVASHQSGLCYAGQAASPTIAMAGVKQPSATLIDACANRFIWILIEAEGCVIQSSSSDIRHSSSPKCGD